MAHYTLTVYREDDSTVWFEVGTDPAHPNPYLHEPGEIDAGEVDFLRGTATIGQVNLRVIDVQSGPTKQQRFLTALLGIPANEAGAGHSALIGRRALYRRDDTVIMDGVIYSVALSDTFAGFTLELRDVRERARKVKLFERTGTSTIFPRGVLGGYGQLPNGDWLVPPTRPVVCTFRHVTQLAAFTGIFDLSDRWRNGSPGYDADATVPPDLVFTDAMREAVRARDQRGRHIHVQIRWRPANGGAWTIIDAPRSGSVWPWNALFSTAQARLRDAGTRNRERVEAIHAISVSTFMQGPWPQDGQQVELLVVYTGPASEAYPFHWEGTAGELLKNIYDGLYSPRDENGNIIPTGVRYDEAAVLALTTPVRLRVTEPVEDMREWTERYVYRAIGAAPALDAQGRISPVRAALPPDGVTLPEVTDENAAPIPGWEHDASDAINIVRVRYQRDFRVPASEDPAGQASAGDGIATREVVVEHRAPQWAIELLGEKVHEIDGIIFRALGGADGSPVTGDITDETGAQLAEQRARETLDRWLLGGQISACRLVASAFRDLRVGDWVIDSRSWRPNYATGQRGGSRLAQVVSVREVNPAWLEVVLVDGGPAAVPLGQPTLGMPTVDSAGVVSVPVTVVPTGGEAAVYYAVSATQPPSDSPLWTFLGRTATPATLTTPALPAGATVWVRARGEAAGRRPSAYTTPVSIVVPSTPRVSGVRILVDGGVATVIWQPNQVAAGVRIYWDIHPRGVPPTYATADVEAGVGAWTVPEPMPVGSVITVEVEPWTGWTGTSVIGTAGPRVVTTAIYDLGGPRRELPFDDGRFAVVALDPAGLVIEPSVRQSDGVAPRALLKGHLSGVARDGQQVIFEHNFQHVPVVLFRGGINYEPRPDKWTPQGLFDEDLPQYDDVAALNLDTSGFTLRARLRQKGTPTERAAYFPTDNVLFQAGQMVDAVLSDAPAVDDRYEVAYQVSIVHGAIGEIGMTQVVVAIDTVIVDANNNEIEATERATRIYTHFGELASEWPNESVVIAVSGLDSNDRIRLRIKSIVTTASPVSVEVRGRQANETPPGVRYFTGTDVFASKTPDNDDVIYWEAFEAQ